MFSNGNLYVEQFGRPPVNQNDKLVLDSPRWTIKFDIQKMSNFWAREYVDEKKGLMIEIVFDCTDPPTGFDSSKTRHPAAREPYLGEANTSGDEGPGPPKSYPLAKLAKDYADNDVSRIKLVVPRSIKAKGGVVWAWPVVVALMLGEPNYSTNSFKPVVEALFQRNLDDYAKLQHPYADFRSDGTGWWQIAR